MDGKEGTKTIHLFVIRMIFYIILIAEEKATKLLISALLIGFKQIQTGLQFIFFTDEEAKLSLFLVFAMI
ncbi:MAG TPA: hypothetical protein PKY80_07835 [Syntrophales bacterium]|nr:hypothetical protein [Syntrophales bacterium]